MKMKTLILILGSTLFLLATSVQAAQSLHQVQTQSYSTYILMTFAVLFTLVLSCYGGVQLWRSKH